MFVGDGQQSIYPGGFTLRSVGLDVRGRSFLLRTNWRNTQAIADAAEAVIGDLPFGDLEDEAGPRPAARRRCRVAAASCPSCTSSAPTTTGDGSSPQIAQGGAGDLAPARHRGPGPHAQGVAARRARAAGRSASRR